MHLRDKTHEKGPLEWLVNLGFLPGGGGPLAQGSWAWHPTLPFILLSFTFSPSISLSFQYSLSIYPSIPPGVHLPLLHSAKLSWVPST